MEVPISKSPALFQEIVSVDQSLDVRFWNFTTLLNRCVERSIRLADILFRRITCTGVGCTSAPGEGNRLAGGVNEVRHLVEQV